MIRIYGASDDLVEIEGDVREELYAVDCAQEITVGDHHQGVRVVVSYGESKRGVWRISVEPIDEGVPMYPAEMFARPDGYSPELTVKCPSGTPVTWREVLP